MASEDIDKKYRKLSDAKHVLRRPGMFIGSIRTVVDDVWIYNKDTNRMEEKTLKYNPGFLKLFDEILTNAADHSRDYPNLVTKIDIEINQTEKFISISNDGPGIPIKKHSEYNVYIPELIFANFRTSTNYDDNQKRMKGGMNGLGAKIVGTFSTKFEIETVNDGQIYKQSYEKNLSKINKPTIKKTQKKDYTKIKFYPELSRFEMDDITDNMVSLFYKRTLDISACTLKNLNITFNKEKIKIKNFENYIDTYCGDKKEAKRVIVENDRWKVAFFLNPFDKFTQFSFVNGLFTSNGGTHVTHVIQPVIKKVVEQLQSKHKDTEIKTNYVKDNLLVFVFSSIENPEFKSQSKEELTSRVTDFGSRCDIKEDIVKQIVKLGIDKNILAIAKAKDQKALNATDGKKKMKILGIPKLDDANWAGGKRSKECTLILTEGDSAKTFAVSGINKIGRDTYGIFPLKGKLLNVRKATTKQLLANEEIINLKTILGLQTGKKYKIVDDIKKDMRYGKVILLTDSDVDGSHIKGLLINFFHTFWPVLVEDQNFIKCLQTPIVKCFKGRNVINFYNLPEYNQWKENENIKGWKIKYYKGLGTSTSNEAKECFTNLTEKLISLSAEKEEDVSSIVLAFDKDKSDDRKEWIKELTGKNLYLDNKLKKVPLKKFFDEEFVLFSIYDNIRSIPNVMDGLKPSQRKVLHGCRKKNLTEEIKVAQLSGYVAEKTAYHHGDMSLHTTIISMAQDYIGSNNINLLEPCGQFGTRLNGGKDYASPRYISTKLNPLVEYIFNVKDDHILNYLDDDGQIIEPEYFTPIIPMLLVNGSSGIGTGYSTNIPCYDPRIIVKNLLKLLDDPDYKIKPLIPWYNNFKGKIVKKQNGFLSYGVWERISRSKIKITELPIGMWTDTYKEKLDKMIQNEKIETFINNSSEVDVEFILTISPLDLNNWQEENKMEKQLDLITNIKTSNMTIFDHKNNLRIVNGPEEILYLFFKTRLKFYKKRYQFLIEYYENKLKEINSRMLFVKGIIDEHIKVFRRKKENIIQQLETYSPPFPKLENSYDYLLKMNVYSFTEEKITELEKKINDTTYEIEKLKSKTYKNLWKEDLLILKQKCGF